MIGINILKSKKCIKKSQDYLPKKTNDFQIFNKSVRFSIRFL